MFGLVPEEPKKPNISLGQHAQRYFDLIMADPELAKFFVGWVKGDYLNNSNAMTLAKKVEDDFKLGLNFFANISHHSPNYVLKGAAKQAVKAYEEHQEYQRAYAEYRTLLRKQQEPERMSITAVKPEPMPNERSLVKKDGEAKEKKQRLYMGLAAAGAIFFLM